MYFLAAKMIEKMSVNNRGKLNITSSNIFCVLDLCTDETNLAPSKLYKTKSF